MKKDTLSDCSRCGSDCCYSQKINKEITNFMCYGCGFQSNSLMKKEGEFLNEQIENLPELYKDLIYEDEKGQSWLPSTINLLEQGMVFANGSNAENWKWSAVKAIEVKDEEKEKYPIPNKKNKYYKHRMDMTTMKMFDERDFMEALTYIGVLPE